MATRSEKSRHREAASSALGTARRLGPRRASADRRLRILERLTTLRIPTKPATDSERKPATDSDLKPAGIPI